MGNQSRENTDDLRTFAQEKGSLREAALIGRFLNDPRLERYERHQLKEYVTFCCKRGFLIEAYALVIQYVKNVVIIPFEKGTFIRDTRSTPTVLEALWKADEVTDDFYNLFREVNEKRIELVHNILRNPEVKEKFLDEDDHTKKLLILIDLAEDFLMSFVKSHQDAFKPLFTTPTDEVTQSQQKRRDFIVLVIMSKAGDELVIEGKPDPDEIKKRLLDDFKLRFEDVVGLRM